MIGYYVHHQGLGHLQRMRSLAGHLTEPLTVLSSLSVAGSVAGDDLPWVALPLDNMRGAVDPTANGTLHWVPQHDAGLRRRMALIAGWIHDADPDLMVVDVSVEVATLCRLLGVPTVVVAMRGDRLDRPHRSAYDAAHAMLAPWAPEFAVTQWPDTWRAKTFHAGAISRYGDRPPPAEVTHCGPPRALVLWGSGGQGDPTAAVAAAAAATPDWDWRIVGAPPSGSGSVWDQLSWADVVITHGGQGAIAEVAAARRPAVVIAEERPHGEQAASVRVLGEAGLAIALAQWPAPAHWPDVLRSARAVGGARWARWAPPGAARRAAGFLDSTARRVRAQTHEPVA
jgi:UDP-N-acetylglucosamine--N-acetylmuramyl-(pentapeptide) pyrophosphoryl-undecaprenol N-acetylglucosamine transferase